MTIPPIITPDYFLANCKRRFGTSNPERVHSPVWEWMVRDTVSPYYARKSLGLPSDLGTSGVPTPDWCFLRMGAAVISHPDGRTISIAGEHEDWYDPNFCIYNDVIVRRGDEIDIYAYPADVFPPTDFHTATLIGDTIWIVGAFGYPDSRGGPETQVLALDTKSYAVRRVTTKGLSPGWIHDHRATLLEDGRTIEIRGGTILRKAIPREQGRINTDVFRFDVSTCEWTKLTDTSSWRQFVLRTRHSTTDSTSSTAWYTGEIFGTLGYPLELPPEVLDEAGDNVSEGVPTIRVQDMPIRIHDTYGSLSIIIEGPLPDDQVRSVLTQLHALLESNGRTVTQVDEC